MARPPLIPHTALSPVLALLVFALVPVGAAADDSWSFLDDTSFELQYEGGYNSNILELSDGDIDRFEANELTLATDVETYDDFVQSLGFRFHIDVDDWWGWRDMGVSYTGRYILHLNNPYNDRPIHNVYASTDIIERVDVFGSWLYIPDRYLRDYYDRDFGTTIGTYFEYSIGGAGVRWSPVFLKGLRLSARYEMFTIYYNPWFTEYDSEGWGVRFDARYKLADDLYLTGIGKYRWADNVGFEQGFVAVDDVADNPVDAEYGDGTYGEEWYELELDWTIRDLLPKSNIYVDLGARLRHRFYDTELPLDVDPIHAGREHWHWRYLAGATTQIVGELSGGPYVEYETRRTDSPLDWVKEAKDFDTWRVYLTLEYDLW